MAEGKPLNRSRIGLFGGSFDPIHRGHIDPVLVGRSRFGLDKVIYLPTASPPHKPGREFAPALVRYCMVEMALLHHEELEVSDYELTLGRPAFTVETVEHFIDQQPDSELFLLIGADSYFELDQWRRWQDLVRLVPLLVLQRPGYPDRDDQSRYGGKVGWVPNTPVDLSATDIRRRLANGEPISDREVPSAVLDYCRKYDFYR